MVSPLTIVKFSIFELKSLYALQVQYPGSFSAAAEKSQPGVALSTRRTTGPWGGGVIFAQVSASITPFVAVHKPLQAFLHFQIVNHLFTDFIYDQNSLGS